MAGNDDEIIAFDGIFDDDPIGTDTDDIICEPASNAEIQPFSNVVIEPQQSDSTFLQYEDTAHGTSEPRPPQRTRESIPVQNINGESNHVTQVANCGAMQVQEGNGLPEKVRLRNGSEFGNNDDGNNQISDPEDWGDDTPLKNIRSRKGKKRIRNTEATPANIEGKKRIRKIQETPPNIANQRHTPGPQTTMMQASEANTSNIEAQLDALAEFVTTEAMRTLYPDSQGPRAFHTGAQTNFADMAAVYLSPSSPLGRLPSEMRDWMLAQARRRVCAVVKERSIKVAEEANNIISRMARNGELPQRMVPKDPPETPASRKRLRTASEGKSPRKRSRLTPTGPVYPQIRHYFPPMASSSRIPVTTTDTAGPSSLKVTLAERLQANEIAEAISFYYEEFRAQLAAAASNPPTAQPKATLPPNENMTSC